MYKVGIIVESLQKSQLLYETINLLNKCDKISKTLFFMTYGKADPDPSFPMMHTVHSYSFDGILIGTSHQTLPLLRANTHAQYKATMLWDLDWNLQPRPRDDHWKTYPILVRSDSHRSTVSRVWDVEPVLIKDFNPEDFQDWIIKNYPEKKKDSIYNLA